MSVKMFVNVIKVHSVSGYMLRPHRATGNKFLMELTALQSLVSIELVDVRCHCSQFEYFENVCSFSYLPIAASLCPFTCAAPLVLCSL
jgi:hypothetical protein